MLTRGQFIHVDAYSAAPSSYSGRRSVSDIANEADRLPSACEHVPVPQAPLLLHGIGPHQASALSKKWSSDSRRQYVHRPSGIVKSRKLRGDSPCALVGVLSVPPEFDDSGWGDFKGRAIAWLKTKYGADRLKSVVEHVDERHRHIHFWVVPRPGELFTAIHQGLLAVAKVGKRSRKALRDHAFAKAMSAYQDEFFTGVAEFFGLKRTSVNGRRVSGQELERIRGREAEIKDAEDRGNLEGKKEFSDSIAGLRREIEQLTASLERVSGRSVPVGVVASRLPAEAENLLETQHVVAESRVGDLPLPVEPFSQIDPKLRRYSTDDQVRAAFKAEAEANRRPSSVQTLPVNYTIVGAAQRRPRPM